MLDWFWALDDGNKITIVIFLLGVLWALVVAYYKWVKPKPVPAKPIPTFVMTLDEFEARIKAKIEIALAEREHASGKDLDIKNAQIAGLRADLANIKDAFEKQNKFIAELEAALSREGDSIGGDALEEARKTLEAGDTTLAETLFAEIKARNAPDVQASARASFALGKIAEQDYRWQAAFEHFSEAARLEPTYAHLIRAQESAHQIANYPEAESLAETALKTAEQEFGKDAPEYGEALNNLAVLLKATGRFEEAEALYRQAVETTRGAVGDDHPEFGIHLNNLAELLRVTGRYEEAEPLFRQAVENARLALGRNRTSIGTNLNNLALLLKATGRFDEAEPLYREALEIARAALGEGHPEFGARLNNLAGLLRATGRLDEAEPLYRQAVAVFEKAFGSDHPSTQKVKANLEGFLANRPAGD